MASTPPPSRLLVAPASRRCLHRRDGGATEWRAKEDRRRDYDALIREVVRRVQALLWHRHLACEIPVIPPPRRRCHRAALGITVRDAEPTPAPAPTTRPVVVVDFSKRLRHTLRYADESTPTRRARPRGTIGAAAAAV